jgi:uncharacterized protein (DUF433 family)
MTAVPSSLVEPDDKGGAWMSRTKTKVIEPALNKVAFGWRPEEVHFQHDYLSPARIHAALAYYYERRAEFDAQIMAEELA